MSQPPFCTQKPPRANHTLWLTGEASLHIMLASRSRGCTNGEMLTRREISSLLPLHLPLHLGLIRFTARPLKRLAIASPQLLPPLIAVLNFGDQLREHVAQQPDVLRISGHDVTKPVVIHDSSLLVAHVEESNGRREESVVTAKDVQRGDVNHLARLVSQLGNDAVVTLKLEWRGTRDEDGVLFVLAFY